ncbi:ABC transporter permease [Crossiella sp. SN42]|uniref:ABC transporter permease n=1 Tax=Crossiella sp. SN42 TaxID=2944808 RepID=UPI00207CD8AC|nr:ABC transporter permease [Crossiella sp. SN42]MCO1580316.1 ABC transporter permease [Crossiella sp. SN42]
MTAAVPRQSRVFWAMLARELHLLRRNAFSFVLHTAMQPALFALVFTYVLPTISAGGAGSPGLLGSAFSSVLVPGMVGNAVVLNAMTVVTLGLVRELSFGRAIEDRMLAPFPLWALGLQKIAWGAVNGVLSGLVVFPLVFLLHAPGLAPSVHIADWPLFLACLVFLPLLSASIGLLLGTLFDIGQTSLLINLVMVPATLLGCVYYPWAALHPIPWLQALVLIDPVVYASETLRAVFTPEVPHMPIAVSLTVIIAGTVVIGALALRSFQRRLLT